MKESQLNLVDLAGSERQKDTNAVGQRLKVSERAIHVLTCTFTYGNGSYFFYVYLLTEMAVNFLFTKSNKWLVIHKKNSKVHVHVSVICALH